MPSKPASAASVSLVGGASVDHDGLADARRRARAGARSSRRWRRAARSRGSSRARSRRRRRRFGWSSSARSSLDVGRRPRPASCGWMPEDREDARRGARRAASAAAAALDRRADGEDPRHARRPRARDDRRVGVVERVEVRVRVDHAAGAGRVDAREERRRRARSRRPPRRPAARRGRARGRRTAERGEDPRRGLGQVRRERDGDRARARRRGRRGPVSSSAAFASSFASSHGARRLDVLVQARGPPARSPRARR